MKTILGSVVLVSLFALPAFAEDKSVIGEKGKKVTAAVAKKEVKSTSMKNDTKRKKRVAPASKTDGGTKRAGANSCDVFFDNRTDLKIQIYVDGEFEGMITPFGDAVRYDVLTGVTKLYGRADFSDGSTLSFGPRVFDCAAYSRYTWQLTND